MADYMVEQLSNCCGHYPDVKTRLEHWAQEPQTTFSPFSPIYRRTNHIFYSEVDFHPVSAFDPLRSSRSWNNDFLHLPYIRPQSSLDLHFRARHVEPRAYG